MLSVMENIANSTKTSFAGEIKLMKTPMDDKMMSVGIFFSRSNLDAIGHNLVVLWT